MSREQEIVETMIERAEVIEIEEYLNEPPPAAVSDSDQAPDPLAEIRAAIIADLEAGPAAIDNATAPRFVSYPRFPVAGGNLAGAGGTNKTTAALVEKVHISCGLDLYGDPVDAPGTCVLVTAEDGAGYPRYVLQQVLRDGYELGAISERVVAQAKQHVRIVGWPRARYGPIVTVDEYGSMHRAPVYDLLLELLAPLNPACVTLDPSVLFSAGERYGNDGDAYLAAMLHESALALGGLVQIVDHVSQSVARTGIVDQHAARGGTAKTDNARLARQLVRIRKDDKDDKPAKIALPFGVTEQDLAEGRLLQLHWTKLSYGPIPPPVWLRRRRYWLEYLRAPNADERVDAKKRDTEQRQAADASVLVDYVRAQLAIGDGIRHSKRNLEEKSRPSMPDGTTMPRQRVTDAVQYALATKLLKYLPLPEKERQGSRQEYLAPADAGPE